MKLNRYGHLVCIFLSVVILALVFLPLMATAQTALDHVRVWRNGNQSIPSASWTTIQFNVKDYDSNNSYSTDSYQYLAPGHNPVVYCAYAVFGPTQEFDAGEMMFLQLLVNDSVIFQIDERFGEVSHSTSVEYALGGCEALWEIADQSVKVQIYQNSGVNLSVIGIEAKSYFTVSEVPYRHATPVPTETRIPTETPIPTDTPNPTIAALVTAIAAITNTGTVTPTATVTPSTIYMPYVVTQSLSSGNEFSFVYSLTAGEVLLGMAGLALLAVGVFRLVVSAS